MKDGWNCPNCGKAHGPHIDTCPEEAIIKYDPLPYPDTLTPTFMPKCGCKPGTICGNAACPHRMVVTC